MSFRGTVDYTSIQGIQGEVHPSLLQAMSNISLRPEGFGGMETLPENGMNLAQLNEALRTPTMQANNARLPHLNQYKGPSR